VLSIKKTLNSNDETHISAERGRCTIYKQFKLLCRTIESLENDTRNERLNARFSLEIQEINLFYAYQWNTVLLLK